MPSSDVRVAARLAGVAVAAACALGASRADAQQQVEGFAIDRYYASAPGAGWLAMDALDVRGGLGGVVALAGGYAYKPLRVATTDGIQHVSPVEHQAFADIGLAVTYDRWRLYLNLTTPVATTGQSGAVGRYRFEAPSVVTPRNPDVIGDPRIGFDVRLLGDASSPFRLGAGAQLFAPNGERADYGTDDTFRAMVRALFAGDLGAFGYAGHLGVHLRPLDDGPAPGSPRGHELLFGLAIGRRVPIGSNAAFVVGPEVFGESAFRDIFEKSATGVEALLSGRLEQTDGTRLLRWKLGTGGGLHRHFGAPEWRIVVGVEVSDHRSTNAPGQ